MKKNAYFLILCLVFFVCACGNKGANETTMEQNCDSVSENMESNKLIELPNQDNALLYLDASHSMKGYIASSKDDRFKNVLSALLYWKDATHACLFDTCEQSKISKEQFVELVNNRKIDWSDESDLHKMIKTMVDQVNKNKTDIVYLLTDGIMSGSNKEIRESINRSFNITSRGTLTARIASAVSMAKDDIALLMIKYTSNFTGTYYCYTNAPKTFTEEARPFYVIAIGERSLINELTRQVEKNELLMQYNEILLLGDEYPYDIQFTVEGLGLGSISMKDGKFVLGSTIKNIDSLSLVGNLSKLPAYMKSNDYFKKNGELYIQYTPKGNFEMLSIDKFSYNIANDQLRITIPSLYLRQKSVYFRLKYDLPGWIDSTSCDDDANSITQTLVPKTFNLKYFVKGLGKINKEEYITKIDTLTFK